MGDLCGPDWANSGGQWSMIISTARVARSLHAAVSVHPHHPPTPSPSALPGLRLLSTEPDRPSEGSGSSRSTSAPVRMRNGSRPWCRNSAGVQGSSIAKSAEHHRPVATFPGQDQCTRSSLQAMPRLTWFAQPPLGSPSGQREPWKNINALPTRGSRRRSSTNPAVSRPLAQSQLSRPKVSTPQSRPSLQVRGTLDADARMRRVEQHVLVAFDDHTWILAAGPDTRRSPSGQVKRPGVADLPLLLVEAPPARLVVLVPQEKRVDQPPHRLLGHVGTFDRNQFRLAPVFQVSAAHRPQPSCVISVLHDPAWGAGSVQGLGVFGVGYVCRHSTKSGPSRMTFPGLE